MKFYKKWPKWLKWGVCFGLVYLFLSLSTWLFQKYFYSINVGCQGLGFLDKGCIYPFGAWIIVNLPGAVVIDVISIFSGSYIGYGIAPISFLAYSILGALIGLA